MACIVFCLVMGVVMICAVGCLVGCEVFAVLGEYFGVGVVATVTSLFLERLPCARTFLSV